MVLKRWIDNIKSHKKYGAPKNHFHKIVNLSNL